MTEYELWLDESGDFEMESQASRKRNPSLAGGVLIKKGQLADAEIRSLVDPEATGAFHAVEMDYETARRIVPPALEGVVGAGGKLVYFENTERIAYHTNRDLYLRVLASGLAQLVKMLSVKGPFQLTIIVALRVVPDGLSGTTFYITPEEYRAELKTYISSEFSDIGFTLDPACRIALTILNAREEARLALADYACNARFVVNTEKYRPVRDRLLPLFDPRYHFTVTALTSEALIRTKLAGGDVSGALMEYFTTRGKISRKKMFREIMSRLESMSYRLQRLQIRKFTSEMRGFAAKETDFERSEALLFAVIRKFFDVLPDYDIDAQYDESLFWIQLALVSMYLREGDILRAGPVMELMKAVVLKMNYRVENLAQLYYYRDRKALYEINCMDYGAAVETMAGTIRTMEDLIGVLSADDLILEYFGSEDRMESEYLGDAYCMKVYAELFLQRTDRTLYERNLRTDSDRALDLYQYSGELERNLQYRSKAENEEGRCREALAWLLRTMDVILAEDVAGACEEYLAATGREDRFSRCFHAMYYIEIMENAVRTGQTELGSAMQEALEREKQLLSDLILPEKAMTVLSDVRSGCTVFEDIFSDDTVRRYHPQEIVLWKYGNCLFRRGSLKAARQAWDTAVDICDENPDYTALRLVSVAVQLERLSLDTDVKEEKAVQRDVIHRCESILKLNGLPPRMEAYISEVIAAVGGPADAGTLYALSRRIAF